MTRVAALFALIALGSAPGGAAEQAKETAEKATADAVQANARIAQEKQVADEALANYKRSDAERVAAVAETTDVKTQSKEQLAKKNVGCEP